MATFNKFDCFTIDTVNGKHNFGGTSPHTFKVMLTNVAPDSTANTVKANISEIVAGNGYTAGGTATTITTSSSSGVAKVVASNVVFTAVTAAMATFRYAVVYNATTTNNPLVCWFDYGSSITLNPTETLTVAFDATNGLLQIS